MKYNIGIAMSGGGIKGACHAGSLKALEERGVKPDILAGVSAGSIVGALYADGYTPDEIGDIFQQANFKDWTRLSRLSGGMLSIRPFARYLQSLLRTKRLEDLPIPLRIVATDLDHGCPHIFTEGNLVSCVVASCSFPIVFEPHKINGVHYVDGGVFMNFPATVLRDDCEHLIGINCSPLVAEDYKVSMKTVSQRVYHFMMKANILHDREVCDTLIEPTDMGGFDTFELDKSSEIFNVGYSSTCEILSDLSVPVGTQKKVLSN